MTTGDAFTRDLFAWLNRLALDREVSPLAFRLAFVIGQHINRKTGDAWPSQQTLADAIGATDRTVRTLVDQLAGQGHLVVAPGRGPRNPNRYRLAENRKPASAFSIDETGSQLPLSDGKTGNLAHENRKPASGINRKPTSYKPSEGNHLKEPSERKTLAGKHPSIADAFEEYWNAYPKHAAKEAARKAFASVLKKKLATAAELIAGAERYAEERRGQDPQYTKHPATWLHGGCWADEPAPASSSNRHVGAVAAIFSETD